MANEIEVAEIIREQYENKEDTSKIDQLKKLNRKAETPALIFGYTFGSIAALIFGAGFCMALKVILEQYDIAFIIGIILGVIGLVLATINPYITKKIRASGKRKYKDQILSLSDEILNTNETPVAEAK